MIVRDARPEDLEGIFAIYDEQVLRGTATFDTVPKMPVERLEWFATAGERYPVLVAEGRALTPPPASPSVPPSPRDAGRGTSAGGHEPPTQILGWARLYAWSPRRAYDRTAENAVYVHADARGGGIGRLLLQELIRQAPARGVSVLVARIVEGNPASRRLHEALGFRTIGVMQRVGEKFGRLLDVRLMDLHLDQLQKD